MCLVYIEEEIKYLSPFSLIQFHWVFMIFCSVADPDLDPGKKFTDLDPDPDPSSTIIFKSQNNGI